MVKFTMLIGLPGSGKSEYALSLSSSQTIVLSSDAIRKEFYGDEAVQKSPEKIFEEMQRRTISTLRAGKNVVYDATNISRKKRKHLLSSIKIPCQKVACVVWARYETCIARDLLRQRTVGEGVIKRMLLNFQPPYYDEGWNEIEFKMNDTLYSKGDYDFWMDCEHDNPHHNNTVKQHTDQVVKEVIIADKLGEIRKNIANTIIVAAQLHDIGKKFVKDFKDSHGNVCEIAHFYSHHNVGSYYAIGYANIQSLDKRQRLLICWLINNHMEPFFKSKYYNGLSPELKYILDTLHACDVKGA